MILPPVKPVLNAYEILKSLNRIIIDLEKGGVGSGRKKLETPPQAGFHAPHAGATYWHPETQVHRGEGWRHDVKPTGAGISSRPSSPKPPPQQQPVQRPSEPAAMTPVQLKNLIRSRQDEVISRYKRLKQFDPEEITPSEKQSMDTLKRQFNMLIQAEQALDSNDFATYEKIRTAANKLPGAV